MRSIYSKSWKVSAFGKSVFFIDGKMSRMPDAPGLLTRHKAKKLNEGIRDGNSGKDNNVPTVLLLFLDFSEEHLADEDCRGSTAK